jgi:TRAP-type uncharacterized transport system substrate-binding protein
VRGNAIVALRRLKADQFASRIALRLNDQKRGLIEAAALTLGEFGQTAYRNQIGSLFRRSLQQNGPVANIESLHDGRIDIGIVQS